ncbi:hypothetical protein NPIL_431401 [Nephila pilipes]|uniref:Uncharacterized protein n=1 Tax=Nephila pilipes TaxID=299642 RepID=A0A8X6MTL1_NEPPI|nr:hypothetical protein NPIL_431401 [Nephila pilipes]
MLSGVRARDIVASGVGVVAIADDGSGGRSTVRRHQAGLPRRTTRHHGRCRGGMRQHRGIEYAASAWRVAAGDGGFYFNADAMTRNTRH